MKIIQLFLLVFIFSFGSQAIAKEKQSEESIKNAIQKFIATKLPTETNYTTKLSQIDNRLHLPLCKESLTIFTRNHLINPGRNSVGVKCNTKKKWMIYTSVTVNIFKDVIILKQPVRRGDIITKDILLTEKRNISKLRSGFFSTHQRIVNKQATRNLAMGTVINQSNITEPKLIKRGEKVTIKASSKNLEISVAGVALMDGIKKQNIRVKNVTTNKTIMATVEKQGLVVVMF